ncbi:sialic acid-binding Ig-like lectin 5 [Colossoma macropomum]|uniref:sialic acid-binding Ig-like lectin 5 n=1 Tax=Colossoma macropomum TaxID=42526 RepID=UPI0018642D91|nr:sialic acid-binding Ig-like lectin 5 [Colossoma macropomum]
MKRAENLTVIYCLFQVALCIDSFSITLPESVEAVRGRCVLIPCTFTIENKFDTDLQKNPKGIWLKNGTEDHQTVFDSTTPKNHKIKGKISGDLKMKNCTTIFNSVNKSHSGKYYFRIEAGELKYNYTQFVSINVRDSLPKPTLSLYRDQMEVQDRRVLVGSSVSLLCSTFSPCPTQTPTLSWSPLPTNSSQEQNQNTSFTSSQLNFITTHLHHGLRINCTATYQLKNNGTKTTQRSLVLHVLYAPKNTSVSVSPSGPVMFGSSVSLNCSSDGNPAVNYTWYRENGEQIETGPSLTINKTDDTHSGLYYCRAQNQHGAQNSSVQLHVQNSPQISLSSHCNSSSKGGIVCVCEVHGRPVPKLEWRLSGQPVPPSKDPSIREESVGSTGLKSFIYMQQSLTGTLQCISTNRLGSTSQLFYSVATFHGSSAGPFHIPSVLVGAAVGASAVMILCTIYLCGRRTHHKPPQEETAGLVLNDRAVCQDEQEEESVYANKNILSPNLDILHYSTIYFPNAEKGSGEIRGLSSLTPDYAAIHHSSREDPERETTEAENSAATEEEQIKPETVSGEEIIQPANEETTYGNIIHHKTPQSDLDPGVEKEQSETKPTEPEQ